VARGTDWVLQLRRLAKSNHGMPLCHIRKVYNAVAVPRILYPTDVFCRPIRKVSGKRHLTGSVGFVARVQRMATLSITGTMRSTATDFLDAHADLKPVMLLRN
ncbi:hypothetical protein K439DRAFT_1353068, partial [Ramaria rubella]